MGRQKLQKLIWIVPILAVQLSTSPVAAQKKLPHNFGDRFAAIAYSPSDGVWGYSYEYKNEAAANRKAMKECKNSGGSCRVRVRVANGCGAIARTGKYANYTAATGKTKSAAFAKAMRFCRKHHGSNCRVEVWACTSG